MKKTFVTGLVLASVIFAAGCNLNNNSANNGRDASQVYEQVISVENENDETTENDRTGDSGSEQNDSSY